MAAGLVVIGIAAIFLRGSHNTVGALQGQTFFSVDDGKTWFADDATKLPPFDKDGQQAVLAHVYRSADGTKFVDYLERYTPDAQQTIQKANHPDPNSKGPGDLNAIQSAFKSGREVKRPGDAKWVSVGDFQAAAKIMAVKCPDGGTDAVVVEP